jgi:hypothetical protein
MGLFGQYANVYDTVQQTIYSRVRPAPNKFGPGSTELASNLKPWIRISSAVHNGLILGTGISMDSSFDNLYGSAVKSGKIGNDFAGNAIFETSTVYARGYRPSPIIDSIGIEFGSEGLTRKLSFQVKCFSLPQLDVITKYFLEPRFYLLAEWGWNTTGGYSGMAKIENTTPEKAVCEMIQYMNLATLKDKRSKSAGHYDAFLGVITGGSLDFGDDETYIVSVEVMTQGEIPAYLQQHRGFVETITGEGNVAKSSLLFNISDITTAENEDKFGDALFMYMFNDLPPQKQIKAIKDLRNQTTEEVSNSGIKVDADFLANNKDSKYWCQEWQYINMNTTYRDKLRETLRRGSTIRVSDEDTVLFGETPGLIDQIGDFLTGAEPRPEFNSEQPLISDSRYIRMELAWRILNEIGSSTIISEPYSCAGTAVKVPNYTISIDNTVIRGHKHMFSVNREFLYIPNALTPDFGLQAILTNPSGGDAITGFLVVKDGKLQTKNVLMNRTPKTYQFPRGLTLQGAGVKLGEEYDNSYQLIDKPANTWGYLKDLYVNFDFFIECLNRNGALIKDVALDILNGLSQGCNMFWDFQIVEVGSTDSKDTGIQKLVVVDANFTGLPKTPESQTAVLLSLETIGTRSPFLDINMKLEVKGALANQVMMQRGTLLEKNGKSSKSSATIEDKVEDFSGLFSHGLTDNLTVKINEIQKSLMVNDDSSDTIPPPVYKYDDDGNLEYITWNGQEFKTTYTTITVGGTTVRAEVRAEDKLTAAMRDLERDSTIAAEESNWVMFMQKAVVVSRLNDPSKVDFDTDSFFNFSGNDADIDSLTVAVWEDPQLLRQVYEYDMIDPDNLLNIRFEPRTNPGYLPIEVTFTILGVSGFKVGDMIHFKDLPHIYREKIFTVMSVNQNIDGDLWKTTVTTACRNIPAPGFELPTPAEPAPSPFPGNTEGQATPPPPPTPGDRDLSDPANYNTGDYWPPGEEPWNQ